MEFKQWLLLEVGIKDIPHHVLESVRNLVGGDWSYIKSPTIGVPGMQYQWRITCEIAGRDVRMDGDKFYLKFFVPCYKKSQWSKDFTLPPGYLNNSGDWFDKRREKEDGYGSPFEKVADFDAKNGHDLIFFAGFIEGWRPGMMPDREIDYRTSAQLKGYPIAVSGPGDFRHDMERIGDFSEEPREIGPWPDHRVKTPYQVAVVVRESIDKFYGRGGEGNDEEPEPRPSPAAKRVHAYA